MDYFNVTPTISFFVFLYVSQYIISIYGFLLYIGTFSGLIILVAAVAATYIYNKSKNLSYEGKKKLIRRLCEMAIRPPRNYQQLLAYIDQLNDDS